MIDPTGTIVSLLRSSFLSLSDGWQDAAIRAGSLQPADVPRAVLISRVSTIRKRWHQAAYRVLIRTYGVQSSGSGQAPEWESQRDAAIGTGHVSDALHQLSPTKSASGVALYKVTEEIGGVPGRDPDTGWEYETSTYLIQAATQVVA